MKLVVGLGNPGLRYRSTRHNIGFMVLDKIASDFRIRIRKRVSNALCGKGMIYGEGVILAKPQTYMNLSGKAVSEIGKREGIAPEDLIVVVDDADLPLGKLRLKPKGSSGGHNGLRSIIEELKTDAFSRLRMGISAEGRSGNLSNYVLAPFKRSERGDLSEAIERGSLCVRALITEGIEPAMNRFNT